MLRLVANITGIAVDHAMQTYLSSSSMPTNKTRRGSQASVLTCATAVKTGQTNDLTTGRSPRAAPASRPDSAPIEKPTATRRKLTRVCSMSDPSRHSSTMVAQTTSGAGSIC